MLFQIAIVLCMLENIENRYKYYYNNLDINTRVEKVEARSTASAKKEKKPERKKMTKADIGGGINNPFIWKLSCCKNDKSWHWGRDDPWIGKLSCYSFTDKHCKCKISALFRPSSGDIRSCGWDGTQVKLTIPVWCFRSKIYITEFPPSYREFGYRNVLPYKYKYVKKKLIFINKYVKRVTIPSMIITIGLPSSSMWSQYCTNLIYENDHTHHLSPTISITREGEIQTTGVSDMVGGSSDQEPTHV